MEVDFFGNDCASFRAYVLTMYNAAKLRLVNYVAGLEAMLHDTEVMYKAFSNPNHPCYNAETAMAYKEFLSDLMDEWIEASKAIKLLDGLQAEMDALTCGESGNLLLAVKLKWDLDNVLKALERVHNAKIDWLKYRGALLRQRYSRECMGAAAPPEIYEDGDTENPDCVVMKQNYKNLIFGTGGLIDQWNAMYEEQCKLRDAAQVGLVNYCAVEGNRECAAAYCAMTKQIMDWFKVRDAAYREKLDELFMVLDSIHCGSNEWPQAMDAIKGTINELQEIINAAAVNAATNRQGMNSIQEGCPLPGMRPNQ